MHMRYKVWLLLLCASALPMAVQAQHSAAKTEPSDVQKKGQQLFQQHCSICHENQTLTNQATYGPRLDKDLIEGNEDAMKGIILNGLARMPGFKYTLQPSQVDVIFAYLKTVQKAPQSSSKP
jgi:mono/diheme cytochrome c family protein